MTTPDPFAPKPAGEPTPQSGPTPPQYGAPQYGAPQYGAPAPYGQPAPQPQWAGPPPYGSPLPSSGKNGFGIAALILGILAIMSGITVIGGIGLGLLAVVFGFLGRSRAKKGEASNGGMALAGILTGVLGILFGIAVILIAAFVFNSDSGQDFQDCLNSAGDNAAAAQQCQDDFANRLTGSTRP